MKKTIRNIILLIFPFLIMVLINESQRLSITEKGHQSQGATAINSAIKMTTKCSWHCHYDTDYCKQHHVQLFSNYFPYTDPIYFGIINALAATKNYRLANIFFLVIFIPLVLYFLLIRSLDIQQQIKHLKSNS